MRRILFAVVIATAASLLGGCAAFNNLNNEVSTYGPWPAARKPASFAFERLPSQQANPERREQLESSARGALEAAGFRAAADAGSAEYLVQLGARVTSNDPWIYNDSLFWRGAWPYGYGHARWGRGFGGWGPWGAGPGLGFGGSYSDNVRFEREVVLLIRDRKTGTLLYEARANNIGPSAAIDNLMPAMFEAALKDFPSAGPNPRSVTTQISKR